MFLDVADNTEDGFSHVILPMNKYTDIPLIRNTVTLDRSGVLSCIMDHYNSPRCVESKYHVKFYDRYGKDCLAAQKLLRLLLLLPCISTLTVIRLDTCILLTTACLVVCKYYLNYFLLVSQFWLVLLPNPFKSSFLPRGAWQ